MRHDPDHRRDERRDDEPLAEDIALEFYERLEAADERDQEQRGDVDRDLGGTA